MAEAETKEAHTPGPWWLVEALDHIGSGPPQRVYSVHASEETRERVV